MEGATAAVRPFDLRRGPAADRLEGFSDQAGVQLVFLVEELRGLRTNRLKGRLPINEALDRLLADTGLVAVWDKRTDTVVIGRRGAVAQSHNLEYPQPMKRSYPTRFFAGLFASILSPIINAQSLPEQSDEEVVRLSPFTVQESADMGRYQAVEASSGTRIRMDLMDSTQSISVVTNEFMQDVGTGRLLDALKYMSGIGESYIPSALDLMNVRGFMNGGATLDGFSQFNWVNQDPIIVDRIEIVKGPNSILAPQGLPGGVVNNVTKRPFFTNKGYVSYEVGRYESNRAEFDANYVVKDDKIAVRVVAAFTDGDLYGEDAFMQNTTVMPMLTYRLSPTTELTAQFQAYNATATSINGTPMSVYAVGRSNVWLQEGTPRDRMIQGRGITRHQNGQNTRFFLTSQITDKLSMRLVGNWVEQSVETHFMSASMAYDENGLPGEVVKLNHITGEWEWDGVTRNDNPTYQLGGANEWPKINHGNLQHDFVYEHTGANWKSQTVMGYAFSYSTQHQRIKNYTDDPTFHDLRSSSFTPPANKTYVDFRDNWTSLARSNQVYIYQVLSLFDDRLVLSGSLSQNRYFSSVHDNLLDTWSQDRAEATVPAGGIVYKITPDVSLYYGFSKSEILGQALPTVSIPPHTVPARQHEGGVRVRLFDGRLYATLAYFDILQSNLYEQDLRNFMLPRPVPPYPPLLVSRTSKGFEFELAWSPTKNFSLIGSYTDFESRDQNNMRYVSVAEKTGGVWGSYTFSEAGALSGLQIGIGAAYVGERPGPTGGVWTEPPAGFTPVRVQPMFWMPSYTVVEASASYRFKKHWRASLAIRNLLDKDYITGANNRSITISTPINPRFTLRYEF